MGNHVTASTRDRGTLACSMAYLSILLLFAGSLAATPALAKAMDLDRAVAFDIEPQPIGSALIVFSRQAHIQVVIAPDIGTTVKTARIHGTVSARVALDALLRNTGLKYDAIGKSLRVTRVDYRSPSSPEPSIATDGATLSNGGMSHAENLTDLDQGNQGTHSQSDSTASNTSRSRGRSTKQEMEEIVVTANKRTETLKEVPVSITALTGETLDTLGIVNFQDYMPYVPSLSQNQNIQPGYSATIIRGLNSGTSQTTATVAYYLDDTPITPASANSTGGTFTPDPDLGDLERIEVLKGPQSTLYGAMTLGGLIKIVTKQPDLARFSSDFSVGGVTLSDGGSGASARGAVNIPLIQDTLAARVSAYDRYDPGFTDNVYRGEAHVNTNRAHGARVNLLYQPIEKLNFELSSLIQNFHAVGNPQEFLNLPTLKPTYGPNQYATPFDLQTSGQTTLLSLRAGYDTGIGTLINSLGFGRYYTRYEYIDLTPSSFFVLPLLGITPDPSITFQGHGYAPETKKLTDELRFASTRMGSVEWQLGLFYTHEKIAWPFSVDLQRYPSGEVLHPEFSGYGSLGGSYHEYAAFGDLTYYLTDALDMTVGTRYSNNQTVSVDTSSPPPTVIDVNQSQSSETYLFSLRWRPSKDLSSYLRVASGYRPGGPQILSAFPGIPLPPGIPTSFGPDNAWNYEVGAKGRWLDGKLNGNLAVYYIAWRNMQLNTLYQATLITGNGGNAKSEGVEFEGNYEPIRGLVIGASAAFDETAMTKIDPSNTAGAQLGDPLPYTPKWSGALTGDYTIPFGSDVKGGVGGSWLYRGWRYTSYSGDPINTRETLPGYSLFSVRGHVDWSHYSLTLHLDNVGNKQTYSNITIVRSFAGQQVPAYATVIEPRTVRLTLNARF